MPNKNYVNGRRKEYKLINNLKALGFPIALRSAGSHSPVDVVGIDILHRRVYFYQCKPLSISKREKEKIETQWNALNGKFDVKFQVV